MEHFDLTHPQRLLWLLLVPLLWWLARPVRPRRQLVSAHLAQWIAARDALRRRRVRMDWLRLLLLCLAVGAAVLAFTRPRFGARPGPRSLAIVLDATGSMAARPVDGGADAATSWQRAVDRVRAQLDALPREIAVRYVRIDREAVVGTVNREGGDEAWLESPPKGAARIAASTIVERLSVPLGPEGEPGGEGDGPAIWTITDGRQPFEVPEHGALTIVGGPVPNVGITALTIDDGWPLPEVTLAIEVVNFSDRRVRCTLQFVGDDGAAVLAGARAPEMTLAAGESHHLELGLRRRAGGPARVELVGLADRDNALRTDDLVRFVLPPPPEPDIAVLSDAEGGLALRAAAEALAAEVGGRVVVERERAGFLLVEGGRLGVAHGARMMTFGTRPAAGGSLTRGDVVASPRVVDWARSSPLLAGLDLSELRIGSALRTGFLGGSGEGTRSVLMRGEHGPLMVLEEFADGGAAVHTAFRLGDSNLPLLAAFPQLLRRAYARSHGDEARAAVDPGALLDAGESDLRRPTSSPGDRELPSWGVAGIELAPWCMLLALLFLLVRLYV